MNEQELIQAQKLINLMDIGDKKCIKEIYGVHWCEISNPNNFGTKFKKAVNTNLLSSIKYVGIRTTGRCDEYKRSE